jgi:hypothetical protein
VLVLGRHQDPARDAWRDDLGQGRLLTGARDGRPKPLPISANIPRFTTTSMNRPHAKPKLVFFQYRYDENLPEFLLIHTRDHVKCLSQYFDVTVIHEDCDYQKICDRIEPDLALFESGVNHLSCRKLTIRNTQACSHVPKLGLHNADPFCNARSGFISDMEHWGVETFFAISTTAAEHTPEIADNLFVWANCIDPGIYRDYGVWKSIPVLFTGNTTLLYPWRRQILKLVSRHYPSLVCPHPGYNPGSAAQQVLIGEQYARTINASMLVPACGTVAKDAVRKHFEIPACNSLLVTEQSAALEAAGFVDMENCVFADESNVIDKFEFLFRNPEERQRITERGYRLVHAFHTFRQRDQIFQWYCLNRDLLPHQMIVQDNPFGALRIVDRSAGLKSAHVMSEGLHLKLTEEGDEKLSAGRYDEAADLYLKSLNYIEWMPEPRLKWALCRLYRGDAKSAYTWISEQIQFILAGYKAADPDPVEWAYFIVTLLCLGKLALAVRSARQFAWLDHPELERARWAVRMLHGDLKLVTRMPGSKHRPSIHRLPNREWSDWRDQVCIMLDAGGQKRFSEILRRCPCEERLESEGGSRASDAVTTLSQNGVYRIFGWRARYQATRRAAKIRMLRYLRRADAKCGYVLPLRLSGITTDECFGEVVELVKEEDIKTAILIGGARATASAAAVLAGTFENDAHARVFCIDGHTRRLRSLKHSYDGRVKCYEARSSSSAELLRAVEHTLKTILEDNEIDVVDAVLVDGSVLKNHDVIDDRLQETLHQARLVVFDNLRSVNNHERHKRLLRDPHYDLVAHNPALRNGYAVFRRKAATGSTDDDFNVTLAGAPSAIRRLPSASFLTDVLRNNP